MLRFWKKKTTYKTPKPEIINEYTKYMEEADKFETFRRVVSPVTGVTYQVDFCIEDINQKKLVKPLDLEEEIVDHYGERNPTRFSAIRTYIQYPIEIADLESTAGPSVTTNVDKTGFNFFMKIWYSCY
jgi:hypothetical protein